MKSWSSTQSIIALSTGEAELYAINKSAATALGLQSLLNDLGVSLDIKIFTDASTGKSIASRKGLGKVRHISVNELWIQDKVSSKALQIIKIKNKFNPADLMTKHLSREEIRQIMDGLDHRHLTGRNADAPELSMVEMCKSTEQLLTSTSPEDEGEDHACMMELPEGSVMGRLKAAYAANTTAGISCALTTNLPGFVCAYGGHTSPPHLRGVGRLLAKQR